MAGCCPHEGDFIPPKELNIDFLYLDLSVCDRCQGTDSVLDEALEETAGVIASYGCKLNVNKVNITTRELALQHRFESSPTIRINGVDIAPDVQESLCEDCGTLCGDEVDCRVWTWNGEEYNSPPRAMIVDAILRTIYTGVQECECRSQGASTTAVEADWKLPENLEKFFASKEKNCSCCEPKPPTEKSGGCCC